MGVNSLPKTVTRQHRGDCSCSVEFIKNVICGLYVQQVDKCQRFRAYSLFSDTTRVSWYWKGKTNLDFTEARDSEWQWHQLGHMQVCTLLQTDNHTSNPPLSFFTGWMPFLPPNQQRQSTEGNCSAYISTL